MGYHARSALIQAVSTITLETFMASFNSIVKQAAATDKAFYDERGVVVHNLEVVRYEPKDAETGRTLQAIIQETTNHINRMQAQKSENEVENEKIEASVACEAEGTRLAQSTLAFMEQLEKSVDDEESRVALLKFFAEQKTEMARASRYASNPQLTTVIEGGSSATAAASAQVKFRLKQSDDDADYEPSDSDESSEAESLESDDYNLGDDDDNDLDDNDLDENDLDDNVNDK